MQIHIGKEIEKVYLKSGMKHSEFARRINTSSRNVYSIFERRDVKTDQLQKIGEILNFDFFSLYKLSGKGAKAEESLASYARKQNKVVITLELDGQLTTLEQNIRRITAINGLLRKDQEQSGG